jgi:hypothetical protein
MTRETIQTAQDFLTVAKKDNGTRKIIDIDQLLKKHPPEDVIDLLKIMVKEKQQTLRDLILADKTRPEVDEMVSTLFRITMAIKTIEGEKEVRQSGRAKQGAGSGI